MKTKGPLMTLGKPQRRTSASLCGTGIAAVWLSSIPPSTRRHTAQKRRYSTGGRGWSARKCGNRQIELAATGTRQRLDK
jgi:hypothetical protein